MQFTLLARFLPSSDEPKCMSVKAKMSKTVPFQTIIGQTIIAGKTERVCPVLTMKTCLSSRATTTTAGPLFQHQSSTFLTKMGLRSETRQLLSISGFQFPHYAKHSFRIGAAISAASVGLPLAYGAVPQTATKDTFNAYLSFSLGFHVSY